MVEIVAEISGNHGGVLNKCLELIDEAEWAGCDYVKFQYYRPEDMPDALDEVDNWRMYNKLMVPSEWLPIMFDRAQWLGIGLFASVFSVRAVKELLEYDIPYIKIASPKSTPLSDETYQAIVAEVPRHVGLIISSDASNAQRMWPNLSMRAVRMYCPPGHGKFLSDADYQQAWHWGVDGLSDHTKGISAPLSFIRDTRGWGKPILMIEKHFKLGGDMDCEDAAFSIGPQAMKQLCRLAHNRR